MNDPAFIPVSHQKARQVSLMAFDVDGVMTDGRLYYSGQGEELKSFNTLDGHGLKMLANAGVVLAIISGRGSRALELRARNLGIEILLQGVEDKLGAMQEVLKQQHLDFASAGYMGDDVVDLPVLSACGFSASVPNGHALVRRHVDYVTRCDAGLGAVREVCELILAAQNKLGQALAPYCAFPPTSART